MAKGTILASKFIAWLLTRVGLGYVYGSVGQSCTVALLQVKERQYGAKMGPGYYCRVVVGVKDFLKGLCARWLGKWVADCSGLIKAGRKALGGAWADLSANGTYLSCPRRGEIKGMPLLPGCTVYMWSTAENRMVHVGVYIGGGWVIEARGVLYGVMKSKLYGRHWSHYGLLDWLTYDVPCEGYYLHPGTPLDSSDHGDASNPKPDDPVDTAHLPYLNYGDEGQCVAFMQSLLVKKGYPMPKSVKAGGKYGMDGIWKANLGRKFCETEKVVRQFQTDQRIEVDGIVGPITWSELLK